MCVTLPGRVESVSGGSAVVDLDGRRQLASTILHPGVVAGDWVMVAVGTIVDRLGPTEAADIRAALRAVARGASPGAEPKEGADDGR
jgi:hydrogenase assembly chaperone HypC/HupF